MFIKHNNIKTQLASNIFTQKIAHRLSDSSREAIKNEARFTLSSTSFKTLGQQIYYNFIWNQFALVNNVRKLQNLYPQKNKREKSKDDRWDKKHRSWAN